MSMPNGYVRCHGCNFKSVIKRRPITLEYLLPSGVVVQGYPILAWCSSCQNVIEAESALDADSALFSSVVD